jgi:hypothetical protein
MKTSNRRHKCNLADYVHLTQYLNYEIAENRKGAMADIPGTEFGDEIYGTIAAGGA